jgi:very-short-patch-repair endonuclease
VRAKTRKFLYQALNLGKEDRPLFIGRARRRVDFPLHPQPPRLAAERVTEPPAQEMLLREEGVRASEPEAIAYLWLRAHQIPFEFQAPILGGRTAPGGTVVDFILYDRDPPLLLRVMGDYWHSMIESMAFDEEQRIALMSMGFPVVDVWERQLFRNADYVLRMALSEIEVGR